MDEYINSTQDESNKDKHVKSISSSDLVADLKNDKIAFSRVNNNKIKLPILRLAVDITVTPNEIKKIFITEMNK